MKPNILIHGNTKYPQLDDQLNKLAILIEK